MRVIAGKLKGRRLASVREPGVRPTSDRVRESLFAILREALVEARFLDLCAGTGSVGIEAYSRGAEKVVFVESHAQQTLQANLDRCGIAESILLFMPAQKALTRLAEQQEEFDIVFIDPPYDSPLLEELLLACSQSSLLASDGCLVAQHRQTHALPRRLDSLCCVRCETYGDTALSFYVWDDDPEAEDLRD